MDNGNERIEVITGRWGKPTEVLLDIVAQPNGVVRGVVNPGRQDAAIRQGAFNFSTGAVHLEGDHVADGATIPFRIDGCLEGRTLRVRYSFGEMQGTADLVRVEEYKPPRRFQKEPRRDFVLVLQNHAGRLIGFTWGKPDHGEFGGQLSKIYLRWEYHGLGLGRRILAETARRFLECGIHSFVLFTEISNPTIGFFDHMGGERLLDEHGRFAGAFAWRDAHTLVE